MGAKRMFNTKYQNLNSTRKSGFTLIELMVVVLIMGILAAIGYPMYTEYVIRGKRSEGRAMLTDSAAKLERYYSDNNKYPTGGSALTDAKINSKSENGHYDISIASTTQTYTLTAAPASFSDSECGNLSLDQTGTRTSTGTSGLRECWGR